MARITAVVVLSLTCLLAGDLSPKILQAASCDTSDIRNAIVGSWRGHALYIHTGRYFYRVEAWFRFTDYGIVELSRGPLSHVDPRQASSFRLRGDYVVAGQNVLVMLDQNSTTLAYTLAGVKATCDQLEFASTTQLLVEGGQLWFVPSSTGFILKRE